MARRAPHCDEQAVPCGRLPFAEQNLTRWRSSLREAHNGVENERNNLNVGAYPSF